jgi:uncharacterized protein YjiS (DUF1127 family)
MVNHLSALYRLWRQRARDRRLAAQFSDRDLWDIGLTRGDIHRELCRPFWWAKATRGSVVPSQTLGATRCSRPIRAAATAAR